MTSKASGSVTEVTLLQFMNARAPTLVTLFGSVMEHIPTEVKALGSVREVRASHLLNACTPMQIRVSGRVTELSPQQSSNTLSLIVCTPVGTTTV